MDFPKSSPGNDMSWVPKSRRATIIAAAAILIVLYTFWNHATSTEAPLRSPPYHSSATSGPAQVGTWKFVADRDRNNHSLTLDQCYAAFPDLYKEIDRSRAYWKARQGDQKLTQEQWGLEWSGDGGLRALIWEGQLYIIESRGLNHFRHWKERSHATLHQLQRAITGAREPIPNIEFSIKINDNIELTDEHPNATVWNFNRNVNDKAMEQVWLIPDFNFWAYPRVAGSFGDYQRQAIEIGAHYDSKKPKLVWRGTTDFNPQIRMKLIEQSEGKEWSDVHRVAEDVNDEEATKWRISMPEHCKYKFAVHTEGTTWSGRLKYLLSCHSTIIIHPLSYTTHLYHLLKAGGPDQNYVQVDSEWKGLSAAMDDLLRDNAKARRIADNAAAIFRDQYFTPAAQICYFRQLFQVWSEMTPTPDPWSHKTHADGTQSKEWRGMTYEEYV